VATVILLNGPGSAGKSTTARALQAALPRPFLHVPMDAFLEMLPEPLQNHPDGIAYHPGPDGTAVTVGPVAERLLAGMRGAVLALADAGNDLILDDVLDAAGVADVRHLLQGHRVLVVGLTAPLDELERREAARGDRLTGLSRDQLRWVETGAGCNLVLDTSRATPSALALRITLALAH
jgi:chloramphenicol 3-O phosphotransferase